MLAKGGQVRAYTKVRLSGGTRAQVVQVRRRYRRAGDAGTKVRRCAQPCEARISNLWMYHDLLKD